MTFHSTLFSNQTHPRRNYGEPKTELRKRTWDALRYLKAQDDLPWICAGDFNEALVQTEQLGGNPRSLAQMEGFREALEVCALADMGFSGYPYTWDNKRYHPQNIQVRLDRATCTDSFTQMFGSSEVEHIMTEESDHLALAIKIREINSERGRPGAKRFSLEEMWTRHDSYDEMVEAAWVEGDMGAPGLPGLCAKVSQVTGRMAAWGRTVFGAVRKEIRKLKRLFGGREGKGQAAGGASEYTGSGGKPA